MPSFTRSQYRTGSQNLPKWPWSLNPLVVQDMKRKFVGALLSPGGMAICTKCLPSVLWHCWLGGRKGIRPVKNGGWWRWSLVGSDGVAPSWMVGMSASVNLPLHHKVQKFSSGTVSPGWTQKKGRKMVVVWCGGLWVLVLAPLAHFSRDARL